MCKVSGVPADSVLESLSDDAVKRLIAEVAAYQLEMFSLRFEQAGSLYHSSAPEKFYVGPIISFPFYRALEGSVRIDDPSLLSALNGLRGPFSTVSDYLLSWVKAESYIISQDPSTVLSELGGSHERLQRGQRILERLKELCEIYPGNTSVYEGATTPMQRFSLALCDFRLSNIMVCSQQPFDFEKTTVSVSFRSIRILEKLSLSLISRAQLSPLFGSVLWYPVGFCPQIYRNHLVMGCLKMRRRDYTYTL